MIRKESIKQPTLTMKQNTVIITKSNKWNLNKILLISFFVFLIFFLYNCKYGMFKSIESEQFYPLISNS